MTEEPTAKHIEAVLTFAERGYLSELGAIDARYTYTAEEAAEMKERPMSGKRPRPGSGSAHAASSLGPE